MRLKSVLVGALGCLIAVKAAAEGSETYKYEAGFMIIHAEHC